MTQQISSASTAAPALASVPVKSPRWERTHAALRQAYISLIDDQKSAHVTVSALTQYAHVHRKTFYLHFESIEEIHDEIVDEIGAQFGRAVAELEKPFDYYDLSRLMFEYYSSTQQMEHIFSRPYFRQLADDIITRTKEHSRGIYNPYRNFSLAEQSLTNTFTVYSSVNVWRRWVLDGKKIPAERAIQLLGDLLEHGIEDLRAPYEPDQDAAIATYFSPVAQSHLSPASRTHTSEALSD